MKSMIDLRRLDDSGVPIVEPDTLTFEDSGLYGGDRVMIRSSVRLEPGEPVLIEISELKRVVKTL